MVNEKVLLHRLSIILYRLFFHQITESVSIIDNFFAQNLGFGVATNFYFNNSKFISEDLNSDEILKAYGLRQLKIKQFITAKEIIENQINRYGNNFDKETIHEITHLSYEAIDELINNIGGHKNGNENTVYRWWRDQRHPAGYATCGTGEEIAGYITKSCRQKCGLLRSRCRYQ